MLDEFIMVYYLCSKSHFSLLTPIKFLTILVVRIYFYIKIFPFIDGIIYSHYLPAGQCKDFAGRNYTCTCNFWEVQSMAEVSSMLLCFLIAFVFFFQTDRELNFDVETAIKVSLTYSACFGRNLVVIMLFNFVTTA